MARYRIALVTLALLALGAVTPAASAAQEATTDPAQQAAEAARQAAEAAAPATMQVADFVGAWSNHNNMLRISPDGMAEMIWRRGGAGVEHGMVTASIERVEGRTLYGTVLTTNYRDEVPLGPFTLTEYDYGVGYLMDTRSVGRIVPGAPYNSRYGITLCGPRFSSAPEWFRGTAPCGA